MVEAKKSAEKAVSKATDQVDKAVEEETDKGFRGVQVDPTDDHAYTVEGVVAGEPTPETDPKQAEKAGSRKYQT